MRNESRVERFAKAATTRKFAETALLLLLIGLPTYSALAQESGDESLEEIVVLGSSIGIRESEIESQALPIQYIGPDQIEMSGQGTVAEMLRQQPVFLGDSDAEGFGPSATLNLRGVGSEYTLALVNGQRFGINSRTNVAMIPAAAIERIEILKAGASAIYGSDAVAGVVNLVLRDSYDGLGFRTSNISADGWNAQTHSIFFGGEGENGRFIMVADVTRRDELAAIDRFALTSNDQRPLGGFDERSSFQNPGRVTFSDGRPSVILDYQRLGLGASSLDPADYVPYDFEIHGHDRALPCNLEPETTDCRGLSALDESDRYSFMARGTYDLSDRTTVSSDLLFHRTKNFDISGAGTFFVNVPATNPHNPFGEDVTVAYRGFPRPIDKIGSIVDRRLDAMRGSISIEHEIDDRWSIAGTVNAWHEDLVLKVPNATLDSAFRSSIQNVNPDEAINVFCYRCNPESVWAGVRTTLQEEETFDLTDADVRITGEILTLPGGPVQLVSGVAWREEKYSSVADPLTAAGAIFDSSPRPAQFLDRSVAAIFGEARIPVLAGSAAADRPRLEASVAVRYEDYSDVGGTFDPLIAIRADLMPNNLALRASWNSSFRAPYLGDLAEGASVDQATFPDPTAGGALVEAQVETGGNPNLDPEDGETFSIGLIATPEAVPGLFASVDFWRLDQDDVIIEPDPVAIFLGEIPGTVIRGNNIGFGGEDVIIEAFVTNFANRVVEGIDLNIGYATTLFNDIDLDLNFAATYLSRFAAESGDGDGLQDEQGQAGAFGALPDVRLASGAALNFGSLTGRIDFSYTGSFNDPAFASFTGDRTVDSVLYTDINFRYTLSDQLSPLKDASVQVGVENVGDEMPPFVRRFNGYSRSLHDIRGRFWTVSLSGRFGS